MRNKYNYNELVKVSGMGKQFGEVKNKLGFIIEKDEFYDDYLIEFLFGGSDWFSEESLERVLGEKRNRTEKYQIRLCTTEYGYELIKKKLKENEPISNNKFKKKDIYKLFRIDDKTYIIIGWKSIYWPVSNKSVRILEDTLQEFKELNIPFQYIILNEERLTDIRIMEETDNDCNVSVYSIERKILLKKKNSSTFEGRERIKNDS